MKKLTKLSFFLVLLLGVFLLIRDGLNPPTYKDCGIVEKKMTVAHGRSRSDLILLINFEKTGKKAIEVDATSYMKYEPRDRVCFMLQDESKQEMYKWIFLYKLFSVFTLFIWVAYWALIRFLPDEDNKKR
jgi:hypothetical protein